MSVRTLLLVGLLALPGIGCRDKGAVRLTISFPDFKPGCLRVSIRDALGSGDERTTELTSGLAAKKSGEKVTVAAWREAGWGNSLRVTALAFERSCEGTPVDTQFTTVTVEDGHVAEAELRLVARDADGDGYVATSTNGTDCDDTQDTVHPGQPELCNTRDDNCDGQRDEGLELGQLCVSELGCGGTRACTADGSVECRLTQATFRLYADRDNDGYGAGPAEESCTPSRSGYSVNADDCDDTRAEVNPGAAERCDRVDNNCDGHEDEGFGLGDTCDESNGCGGKKECGAGGEVQCVYATEPQNHYPDDDMDGYGRDDGAVMTCKPPEGYVLQGGDCNDGNRFTHPGASELCDQEDNDCDYSKDENACPAGGAKWTEYSSTGADSWMSVSLWDEGKGVWVAGGNKYEVRRPGQPAFETPTNKCAGASSLNAVWASSPDGVALLGGNSGFLGGHAPGGNCVSGGAYAAETNVQGLTEVPWPVGKLELHFGGVRNSEGRMFWSDKTSQLTSQDVDRPVYDVHGLSRETLFAVGGTDPALIVLPGEPRIYRFKTGSAPWTVETLQPTGPIAVVKNRLRGVWVVSPRLAYAVGNGGAVLIWDGTTWRTHKSPSSEDLLSVVAFGKKSVYVTTSGGKVYRYGEDDTWTKVHEVSPAKPLNDIAGSSPGDLWVVGEQGKRVHWPQ